MLYILILSFSLIGIDETIIVHKEMKSMEACEEAKRKLLEAYAASPFLSSTRQIHSLKCVEVDREI